jgi:hypothetical protein
MALFLYKLAWRGGRLVVAAINVLMAGHARMACGSNRTSGRKQEPTEATMQWPALA